MEITGSHLRKTHKYPVILKRGRKWTPEELESARKRKEMELLIDAPKLSEGRGRQASNSSVDFAGLYELTDTDNVEDAARHLVSLKSPMVLAKISEDWKGSIGGAQKLIREAVEGTDFAASFRKVDGANAKTAFMFTFRQLDPQNVEYVEEVVEIGADDVAPVEA